jgi:hypothetical protein
MSSGQKQKLYCYVDETGQDTASSVFVVVAVVRAGEQDVLREALVETEIAARTGHHKWHKTQPARRLRYLNLLLEKNIGCNEVFFGSFLKPLPFFFPMIEVVETALKAAGNHPYSARVFVDGIDRKKAAELTNALRVRGVSLEMVRGRRDESEPIIRLADMWAGCIRGAELGKKEERELVERALERDYIKRTNEKTP